VELHGVQVDPVRIVVDQIDWECVFKQFAGHKLTTTVVIVVGVLLDDDEAILVYWDLLEGINLAVVLVKGHKASIGTTLHLKNG
jgi:hypothetical protein